MYDFNVRVNSKQLLKNFKVDEGYNRCYESIHGAAMKYGESGIIIAGRGASRSSVGGR